MKHLVTSGCSFTETRSNIVTSWAKHLAKELDLELHNYAYSSMGNSLIARQAIYGVEKLLETNSPEDILVGIMWSGADRGDYFDQDVRLGAMNGIDSCLENPISFVEENKGNWIIQNAGWNHPSSNLWYKHFWNPLGGLINTLEKVMWTQNYLDSKGVKYFMSTYSNKACPLDTDNINLNWMRNSLDLSKFCDFGMYEWCRDHGEVGFTREFEGDVAHPNSKQHLEYTNKVIIPYLKQYDYI
jgi:hypothetical protein